MFLFFCFLFEFNKKGIFDICYPKHSLVKESEFESDPRHRFINIRRWFGVYFHLYIYIIFWFNIRFHRWIMVQNLLFALGMGQWDGHDTDTKYRYCRYLRVGVSSIPPSSIASFRYWVCSVYRSMYVWKPQENVNQSEEKAEVRFFSRSMFDGIGSK